MLLLWIEGVRDKRGIQLWCKICGGGGVVVVTPGWDRGEENQRMGGEWGRVGGRPSLVEIPLALSLP